MSVHPTASARYHPAAPAPDRPSAPPHTVSHRAAGRRRTAVPEEESS